MTTTLRARFDGKVLIPQGPVDLEPGKMVQLQVTPLPEAAAVTAAGATGAGILRAIDSSEPVLAEDVDELDRKIEEEKLPVRDNGAFEHGD